MTFGVSFPLAPGIRSPIGRPCLGLPRWLARVGGFGVVAVVRCEMLAAAHGFAAGTPCTDY